MAHGIYANGTYPAPSISDERVYCNHEDCIDLLDEDQATICARCKEPFCAGHIYEVDGKHYCSFCEESVVDAMTLSESEEADRDQFDWDGGAYRG